LPADRYLAAERQIREAASATTSLGVWEPLGPGNTAGRIKALVIDPTNANTMYAAAATGGIWKTGNAGQTWMPLTDSLPTLAMSSLAMDPSNPKTLYAGSGEQVPGAGIFKSSDAGQTWKQLAPTAGFAYVFSIAISLSRPTNIYAATDSGLWASSDAGATWTNALPAAGGCFSTVVRGDQPADIVFATCSQAHGYPLVALRSEIYLDQTGGIYAIYRGDMASGTWQMVCSDPAMSATVLAIAPTAPNTIYALASNGDTTSPFYRGLLGLYASDQGGLSGTWEQRANTSAPNSITANILGYPTYPPYCDYNTPQGHYGHYSGWNLGLAVDPTNSQILFAAGVQLSRSMDGGRTFAGIVTSSNLIYLTDFQAWAFHPSYNGISNQTVFVTNDDGIYQTSLARTYLEYISSCSQPFYNFPGQTLNNGLQVTQFYLGAVTPGGGMYLGGSQDTVVLLGSAAAPSQWIPIYGGDGGMVAFDPLDPNTMYFEYQHLSLAKSTDGGNTYVPATTGITEPSSDFPFLTYFALDPRNSQTLYMGGQQLWRSTDGAQTWTAAAPNVGAQINAISVNPANSNQVMYGDINGVIHNGTVSPGGIRWASSQPRSGYVSRIVFDPSHSGTIYATYATFRGQASDMEVYRSTDGGNTWSGAVGASLPDMPVHVLVVDPDASSTLYAGTDLGVFVSFDSGATWANDSSLPSVITESLQIDRTGASKYLYAFTYGRGLWRVNLTRGASACSYAVSPQSFSVDGNSGELYSVQVNTAPGCAWAASSILSTPYVRIQSPAGGSGPGTLYFMLAGNYSGSARPLQIGIQDQTVTIQQASSNQPAAAFDALTSATPISSLPYYRADGFSSLSSTAQDPVLSCTGSRGVGTGWFVYTASASQRIDVTSAADGGAVALAAYAMQGSSLGNAIGCATNAANAGVNPSLQFDIVAGASYAIEISGVGQPLGNYGPVILTVQALPTVAISGGPTQLAPGQQTQFTAMVTGVPNTAVRWTARYGSIDANGNYTAPVNLRPGQALADTVTALSFADANASASVTIAVLGRRLHRR